MGVVAGWPTTGSLLAGLGLGSTARLFGCAGLRERLLDTKAPAWLRRGTGAPVQRKKRALRRVDVQTDFPNERVALREQRSLDLTGDPNHIDRGGGAGARGERRFADGVGAVPVGVHRKQCGRPRRVWLLGTAEGDRGGGVGAERRCRGGHRREAAPNAAGRDSSKDGHDQDTTALGMIFLFATSQRGRWLVSDRQRVRLVRPKARNFVPAGLECFAGSVTSAHRRRHGTTCSCHKSKLAYQLPLMSLPSPTAERHLGLLLADINRLVRREFDRRVRPLGLTRAQWMLLQLSRQPGVTQSELAEQLQMEKISVSRRAGRLQRAGWIERRDDAEDGRPITRFSPRAPLAWWTSSTTWPRAAHGLPARSAAARALGAGGRPHPALRPTCRAG